MQENQEIQTNENIQESAKVRNKMFPEEKKKRQRILRYVSRIVWDFCAVLALLFMAVGTFHHMKQKYFVDEIKTTDENSENPSEQDGTGTSVSVPSGTWCTLKSNSLDGVPIYPMAGETFQSGLLPEGKCCQLMDTQVVEGEIWAQVSYCGQSGWLELTKLHYISSEECYIKQGDIVYMNALSEKGINGYAEPSGTAEKVAEAIRYGTEFQVAACQDGWGLVQMDGKEFWLNMYHMGSYPTITWKVETLSSAAEINLREKPDEEAKSLGKVPEDTIITVEKFKNGWGKIQYNGQKGWVMLHYLTPVEK